MRVVVVLPSIGRSGGGVSEAARRIVREWAKRPDAQLTVLTLDLPGFQDARMLWPDVEIHAFRPLGPLRFGFSPGLAAYLLRRDFDIAHVHGIWMHHCLAVLAWSRRWHRPYLVSPHGMLEAWILKRSRVLKTAVSILFHRRFLKRAAAFHVLTASEARDVGAAVPGASCLEVPNFVEPEERSSVRPSWWRPKFEGCRVVLFFGRIHDKKGWRELIEAWSSVCTGDPAFRDRHQLVFCGWLDGVGDFEAVVARENALHGNLLFAGSQYGEDRHRSYSAADVFILPSKSEGLPMSVLEAWALGLPVLMTEACNLTTAFEVDGAVRIGQTKDELIAALRDLGATTPLRLAEIGERGRCLQIREYSPDACAGALWQALRRIAEDGKRS